MRQIVRLLGAVTVLLAIFAAADEAYSQQKVKIGVVDLKQVSEKFEKWMNNGKYIMTTIGSIFKTHDDETSFFYKVLRYLIDSRDAYKDKMKQAKDEKRMVEYKRYKNIQHAYKILANSLYGVLANTGFRFFSHELAGAVTAVGQEAIKFIGYHVGQYMDNGSLEINKHYLDKYDDKDIPYLLYTDTDSIFLKMGEYLSNKDLM